MEEQRPGAQPLNPTPVDATNKVGGDLYAAITAEDEPVVVAQPKKHVSPFMAMLVAFMRVTFWMDLTRRSNEGAFRILSAIWTTIMAVLYVSGLLTLFLCLTSFVELPLKLEKFFSSQNIQFDSLKMADYSLSQINITNLHDAQNLYQIPNIQVHSTFGDFLKNKILSVDVEGPKINFKTGQKENSLQWLLGLISHFNGTEDKKIDISSLNVSNAVLTILGKHLTIPVSFTVTGKYAENMVTSISFNVSEDFLNIEGTMQISGSGKDRQIEIKIPSGYLTLPNSPEEDVKGDITLEITNNEIQKINSDITLKYGYSEKNILVSLNKNDKQSFDGELTFTQKNKVSDTSTSDLLTDFTLGLKDIKIDEQDQITTNSPLDINIRRLSQNNLVFTDLNTQLNGTLTCLISEGQCQYQLAQAAQIQLNSLDMKYKDQRIVLNNNQSFKILPKDPKTLVIQFKSPELQTSFMIDSLNSKGFLNEGNNTLDLVAERLSFDSIFSQKQGESKLALEIHNGNLITPNLALKQMEFNAKNIFDETSSITLKASSVTTNSPLIKKPVTLELVFLNNQSSLKAQIVDTDIIIKANGDFQPLKGTFAGNVASSIIQLENLPYPLYELSDFFPQKMTDVSGNMRIMAQPLNYGNKTNIFGKIYVAFKNTSFSFEKTQVSNLNTVIALKSLAPLVSAPNQHFFIENIRENLDLTNVNSLMQIDSRNLKLFNLTVEVANQPLSLTSATISLQHPETILTFKSYDYLNVQELAPYVDLQGITFKNGVFGLSVPVEVSEKGLSIPSVLLKLSETELASDQIPHPLMNIFRPDSTGYFVRSGKLILNPQNKLQAEFDGWYLPQRQKYPFSDSNIQLSNPLFLKGNVKNIPSDIWERLNILFTQG